MIIFNVTKCFLKRISFTKIVKCCSLLNQALLPHLIWFNFLEHDCICRLQIDSDKINVFFTRKFWPATDIHYYTTRDEQQLMTKISYGRLSTLAISVSAVNKYCIPSLHSRRCEVTFGDFAVVCIFHSVLIARPHYKGHTSVNRVFLRLCHRKMFRFKLYAVAISFLMLCLFEVE